MKTMVATLPLTTVKPATPWIGAVDAVFSRSSTATAAAQIADEVLADVDRPGTSNEPIERGRQWPGRNCRSRAGWKTNSTVEGVSCRRRRRVSSMPLRWPNRNASALPIYGRLESLNARYRRAVRTRPHW